MKWKWESEGELGSDSEKEKAGSAKHFRVGRSHRFYKAWGPGVVRQLDREQRNK